jgi:hypothetical protein
MKITKYRDDRKIQTQRAMCQDMSFAQHIWILALGFGGKTTRLFCLIRV